MAGKKTATPRLIADLAGHHVGPVNEACYVESVKAVISVSDDKYDHEKKPFCSGLPTVCCRNIIVWLRRDDGTYWPSISHGMPSAVTALFLHEQTHRLFVGLEQGNISVRPKKPTMAAIPPYVGLSVHLRRVNCILHRSTKSAKITTS